MQDDNAKSTIYGVSHRDGKTLVPVKFNGNRMKVDRSTAIEFNPTLAYFTRDGEVSLAKATSLLDDATVMPWVVNEDTGAVLISIT